MEKKTRKKKTGGKPVRRKAGRRPKAAAANGSSTNGPIWKPHLHSYRDLRALQFHSDEDFARSAEILWSDELRDLPFDLVGNHTVIVPAEAIPYFEGLEFSNTEVLSPTDLPPEERARLRKEQGPY